MCTPHKYLNSVLVAKTIKVKQGIVTPDYLIFISNETTQTKKLNLVIVMQKP